MAVKPMPVHGADISHYQDGKLDLAGARKRGLRFLYHKATEGTTYVDPNFARRRAEASKVRVGIRRLRLRFGGYHFARPKVGNAIAEAKHFLSVYRPHPGDLRPALDLEVTNGLSNAQLRTWAKTFVDYVEKETGVRPVVYGPFDLGDAVKGCLIWRPRYNNSNARPTLRWDIWQFSNGVFGVPNQVQGLGHVDLNTLRDGLKPRALFVKRKHKEPTPTPDPTPTPEPDPTPEPPKHVKRPRKHRVATFNAEFGHKPVKDWAAMILDRFEKQELDVLALEEAQDYTKVVTALFEKAGHQVFGHGDESRNLIFVRKGLDAKRHKAVEGDVQTWFTPDGREQSMPVPVVVNVEGVLYVCIHGPVTAWIPGGKGGRTLAGPANRVEAYKDFMRNLVAFLEAHDEVCVLGDWNATPDNIGDYSPAWLAAQTGSKFLRPHATTGHGEIDFGVVKGAKRIGTAIVVPHKAFLVKTATAKAPNPDHSDHMEVYGDLEWAAA